MWRVWLLGGAGEVGRRGGRWGGKSRGRSRSSQGWAVRGLSSGLGWEVALAFADFVVCREFGTCKAGSRFHFLSVESRVSLRWDEEVESKIVTT